MSTMQTPVASPAHGSSEAWPAEVELILSALEAAAPAHDERRQHQRVPYRALAQLRLFSDQAGQPLWTLYSRDVSVRGMGFITPHRLPLGYGGVVQIPTPRNGRMISVAGTLFRCREVSSGWFEGSLYFNREQWIFSPET